MKSQKKVVIIGGGIGGLAIAALLGKKGNKVTLLEKNNQLGGRARVFKRKGFTFDMGPSWYMMPEVFENYFKIFGKKSKDFYKLKKLSPRYRVFFEEGRYVDLNNDLRKDQKLFEKLEKNGSRNLKNFLKVVSGSYDIAGRNLVYENLSDLKTYLKPNNLQNIVKLISLYNPLTSLQSLVSKYFTSERAKKIITFPSVFLGGSPYNTPALYSLMAWADFGEKIWYPMGGINKLVKALEKLCKENGVEIKTKQEASKIIVEDGKATQVAVKNKKYKADIVISDTDYAFTETKLLNKDWQTYPKSYWEGKTLAISGLILYLGVKGRVKNIIHHNLFFNKNWQNTFKKVFNDPSWPKEPSFYVSARSKSDPTLTPKNCEELFFLVPLSPHLKDTDKKRKEYADFVIEKFEDYTGEKISDRLLLKEIFSQKDFAESYNAYEGTALGIAHTLNQSLILRPKNKSAKVKNLFYVGQYTNPGVGLPMAIISAQIVSDLID